MINRELYINDVLIDLDDKEVIELVFQVNDIADLQDRQASYSSEFVAPPTINNSKAFNFSGQVQTNTNYPYLKLPCRYVEEGVVIIKLGAAIISQYQKGYKITLYTGIFNFYTLLASANSPTNNNSYGLRMTDIDTSEIDNIWDNTLLYTSWLPSKFTDKLIGALIDTGLMNTVNGANGIDAYHQHPSIYIKYLLNKIFSAQGYTLTGNVWNTIGNRLDRALLPVTNHIFNWEYQLSKTSLANNYSPTAYPNGYPTGAYPPLAPAIIPIAFDTINDSMPSGIYTPSFAIEAFDSPDFDFSSGPSDTAWTVEMPGSRYRCYARGTYSFRGKINFTTVAIGAPLNNNYSIAIYKRDGNNHLNRSILLTQLYPGDTAYQNQTFSFDLKDIQCERGDRIYIVINPGIRTDNSAVDTFTVYAGSYFECYNASCLIGFGDWYQLSINLPNILQSEFLKNIFQLLCISPSIDDFSKVCTLNQFDDLMTNIPKAINITEKIDRSVPEMLEYRQNFIFNFGLINWFRYNKDSSNNAFALGVNVPDSSDTINDAFGNPILDNGIPRGFADSFFNINDLTFDTLAHEILTLSFGATLDNVVLENIPMCRIILYNFGQYVDSDGNVINPLPFSMNGIWTGSGYVNYTNSNYVVYKGRLYQYISGTSSNGLPPDNEAILGLPTSEEGGALWKLIEDRTNTVQPRIIILDDRNILSGDTIKVYFNVGAGSVLEPGQNAPITYFNKSGAAYNIDWADLFLSEYATIIKMVQQLKKLTVHAYLKQTDIDNLNFFIPVYEETTNSFYYINKIVPYTAGMNAIIEMIKLY